MKDIHALVAEFARHVQAQTEAIWRGEAKAGNKHADQYLAIFDKLRIHGDAGRNALATLFTHPRMDVRVSAAAMLLRHRTVEAKTVLEEAAKGQGMIPFGASQALKRWEEGTWALDPAEDDARRSGAPSPASPARRGRDPKGSKRGKSGG